MSTEIAILELEHEWRTHPRWARATRPYRAADVIRVRGSLRIEPAAAHRQAERLWDALHSGRQVSALGALTGNQAVQMARKGVEAIHVSAWPVAGDADRGAEACPTARTRPSSSVASVVRRIDASLERADEIDRALGRGGPDGRPVIVADAGAGCGRVLNPFEVTRRMIAAGAACVQLEDRHAAEDARLPADRTVLAPAEEIVQKLVASRFAADVAGASTLVLARTHALGAGLGMDEAVARALAYAPNADVLWCETATPDLEEARRFAQSVHARLPGKLLAHDCSPALDGRGHLDGAALASSQRELGSMGYRFVLVTRAGFGALEASAPEPVSRGRAAEPAAPVRLRPVSLPM